jgi:uncharacterized protein (DUF433 family)
MLELQAIRGKPCIRGHRIWVYLILDHLADDTTIEEVLEAYPSIEREDVLNFQSAELAEIALS